MNILVTGADGLVGNALRRNQIDGMIFTTRQECDLTDFNSTLKLFQKYKPQKVIHLAAVVGGIGGNIMHTGEFFRSNILINTNVLEAARLVNVRKLISFMSTCVFPDDAKYPLRVEDLHNGPPHPSNFGYAYAKRMLEVQSSAYRKEWGCNFIVAVPTNIYGPDDNFNLAEGHVVPALIHRARNAKKNNENLNIWGSGTPLREFVYVDDIADIIVKLLEKYEDEKPIIISSGIETSISQLVELIASKFGLDGKITYDLSKPDGQYRKPSNVIPFNKVLPNYQWTDLKTGISKTIRWFEENYESSRK